MENKIKRPVSVWIAQILLAIFVLMFLGAFLMAILIMLPQPGISIVLVLITAAIELVFAALYVAALWGMVIRKPFGRWLGVGVLSLGFIVITLANLLAPSGPIERYEYSNSIERTAGVLTQVFISCLILAVILRVAFAKNVSAFFAQTADSSELDAPPSLDP